MNHEELAFVNQQLAGMLQSGLPLEGSLRQLCTNMRRGRLRAELSVLEAELARGTPLKDALAARQLPEFYKHMLLVGAKANDLPGVLLLLADHYSRTHSLKVRLRGLLVYPALVLLTALALSAGLAISIHPLLDTITAEFSNWGWVPYPDTPSLWFIPTLLLLITVSFSVLLIVPRFRRGLRWRLPAFKDASLAHLAASLHLLVAKGVPVADALALTARLEAGTRAGEDLTHWGNLLSQGSGQASLTGQPFRVLPPLFFWLTAGAGEDLPKGLQQAAEVYGRRAAHRSEMVLLAALPVSILLVGLLVLNQFLPLFVSLTKLMDALGGGL
jgi:type II secretory pathway component PulF